VKAKENIKRFLEKI